MLLFYTKTITLFDHYETYKQGNGPRTNPGHVHLLFLRKLFQPKINFQNFNLPY